MKNEVEINLIDRKGLKHKLIGPTDMNLNLMELIKLHEYPVEGTCGGMAMCASCQVYILSDHIKINRNDNEQAMLDEAWHVKDNSRLSCQIPITNQLDGLIIELAPETEVDEDW